MTILFKLLKASIVAGWICAAAPTFAGTVVVLSDQADAVFRSNGVRGDASSARLGAATGSPGAGARVNILVFQLPTPGPGEQPVVQTSSFAFTILNNLGGNSYGIDLYALPARTSPATVTSDPYFFFGASDPSAGAWKLEDSILSPSNTLTGRVQTSADANALLTDYLNAQYGADGSGAGKWVFIRMNPDQTIASQNSGVDIAHWEFGSSLPSLTIELVPEPSLLLPIALLAAGNRRRRRVPH